MNNPVQTFLESQLQSKALLYLHTEMGEVNISPFPGVRQDQSKICTPVHNEADEEN